MSDLDKLSRNMKFKGKKSTKKTVVELKAECKAKGIKGYSKLKRDELLELLGESDEVPDEDTGESSSIMNSFNEIQNNNKVKKKVSKKSKKETICDRIRNKAISFNVEIWTDGDQQHWWHPESRLVFSESVAYESVTRKKEDRKFDIVVARVDNENKLTHLVEDSIHLCKEYGFRYIIPDILKEKSSLDNIEVKELDELETLDNDDYQGIIDEDEDDDPYDDVEF